ncbi:uncharacterized protein ALTATR162_LOCUS10506 [Alternaria atra]|uniref:Uncharacterized protein n=1 Tax=Alternaria atra TaxID=119953 RepID=A0A8J2IK68_9PLEO|nr:uncharacterized protein ALTATR162_LOCUS8237 [Alternaria atra]XP_043174077.1 uncharacterized protein ALTATR162_LOCUS10506 [Alternaria atra]CAG5175907.1 unnamed protein product [Alternaria atra]CAG5183287.1 unnamed protein product [Alternaria atra]
MSNAQDGAGAAPHSEADLAQAFKELQRGEQTAAALESHLDSIEKKIEALLAQAEKAEQELKDTPEDTEKSSATEEKGSK